MTDKDIFRIFEITDILSLPTAIMTIIEGDVLKRNYIYQELLKVNNNDVSRDWFQNLYESELAERNQKKQDFTPLEVGILASKLTGIPKGIIHEPTAGNGGMIISDWWGRCLSVFPLQYKPVDNLVSCWELSERSIPILLLNLSIRGIMGEVIHGDVLEKKIINRYVLINENNDLLAFSKIIKD